MIKFETNYKTSPSWNPKLDFSHNVSIERNQPFLAVFPRAMVFDDNTCMIYFNCFGLRYKHFDKFEVNLLDGSASDIQKTVSPVGNLTGSEPCLQIDITPVSEKGIIQITDSFSTHELSWKKTDEHLYLKLGKDQVMIHFEQGVIDIPNQETNNDMIAFLNTCKKHTTDESQLAILDRQIAKYTQRNSIN
jgi:hypothetical protein